ncbi:hypothetical protein KIH87_00425 [Paraneptunicella aestuarii]|uniref:hypothetical protein n=1 Tax=Paraneptunicella aestuarii TaxID=2831148 RepID=UPI001E612037|nr:hypothetical protein [Paraneptunicella aestuarii]UAA38878.1 hypothetical protein KIH87_00425 [Paraneptunicella aestuarii]
MKLKLLWPVIFTITLPLMISYVVYPDHLPPGFGLFPPTFSSKETPGFNLPIFIALFLFCFAFTWFLLFPKHFGFKGGVPIKMPNQKAPFPWWFWLGTIIMIFFWGLMWSHSTAFGELVYWSFTPLWWGFILFLDGIVFHRNNGVSLLHSKPITMFMAYIVSIGGWVYFEFYDYFVLGNWYYPQANDAPWSHLTLTIEFLVTYGTITVVFFEWYSLFKTFPNFPARYQNGPKMKVSGNALISLGSILIAAMVIWPYPFFWVVWIGPFAVLSGVLINCNIQNTFLNIAQRGDWSDGVLMGLASLFNGFVWEFWNYGSVGLGIHTPTNPNYWDYNIPYVDVIFIFSDMPLLGYFGYIPFGVLVCQTFIWAGVLFGFNTDIELKPNLEQQ